MYSGMMGNAMIGMNGRKGYLQVHTSLIRSVRYLIHSILQNLQIIIRNHQDGMKIGSSGTQKEKAQNLNPDGSTQTVENGGGIHLISGIQMVIGTIIHGRNGTQNGKIFLNKRR